MNNYIDTTNPAINESKVDDSGEFVYLYMIYSTEHYIFTKPKGGKWLRFRMYNKIDEANTQDNWRVRYIMVGDGTEQNPLKSSFDLTNTINITDPNNTHEYAYKEVGSADHVGNSHGKEIVTSYEYYMDGKKVQKNTGNKEKGKILEVVKESDVYSEINRNVVIAKVQTRYIFTPEKTIIHVVTRWQTKVNLEYSWVSLFPFYRGSKQSDRFRFINSNTEYDVSVDGSSVPRSKEYGGLFYNASGNGLYARLQVLDPYRALNNFEDVGWSKSFIGNSVGANKFYIARKAGDEAGMGRIQPAGTVWDIKQQWEIFMPES